jgi:hypothetical protein
VKEPLRKVHEGILRLLEGITITALTKDDPLPQGNPPPGAVFGGGHLTQILPS